MVLNCLSSAQHLAPLPSASAGRKWASGGRAPSPGNAHILRIAKAAKPDYVSDEGCTLDIMACSGFSCRAVSSARSGVVMSWSWLKTLWQRKKRHHWEVVMYTRQGCHLCEQAWLQLERARRRHGFALRQIDVDSDSRLVREYGECVPVVTIDGRVRFRGVVNGTLLERLLSSNASPPDDRGDTTA